LFTPAYTWTAKIRNGNFDQILKANESNLDRFEKTYGKVDIIHAHVGYPGGYIAKLLSKTHGISYVITEHMSPFPHTYFLTKTGNLTPLLVSVYRSSVRNICVSCPLEESMKSFGISNTCVIPNMVDESFFTPKKSQSDIIELLSIGRLEDQKGFTYLLKAFQRIRQTHSNAKLKIIGEGSLRHQLEQQTQSMNLNDSIKFVGIQTRDQVRDAIQSCTLFVLASIHENLPLVLLEAIACGKPVVATKCKGPEEIINKKNGRLAEPKNAQDLSIQIEHILSNIGDYHREDIRKDFEKRYSQSVVCDQIFRAYEKAIKSENNH
jgi:glycosyltransferase involved in cell wall biosynthesis